MSDSQTYKLLFYRGSCLVRWQTRSKYGHVAVKAPDGAVYEALANRGIVCWPHGRPDECLADAFEITVLADTAEQIEDWLKDQVGKRYDWLALLRFISRRRWYNNDKWFCSELAFAAFEQAGVHFLKRCEPWEVSPGRLVQSPVF